MAAYAALVSLMNNLEDIRNHPLLSTSFDKNQIESLCQKLDFFLAFVESCDSFKRVSKEEVADLESQIARAAHAAEDVMESHMVNQIFGAYSGECPPSSLDDSVFLCFLPKIIFFSKKKALKITENHRMHKAKLRLHKIMGKMDIMKGKVLEAKMERGPKDQVMQSSIAEASSSSRPPATAKASLTGVNTNLHQLLDWLTGQQSDRQIISITGMGGIGKTTLAKNVYEDLLTVQHFDVRAWATVSQEYNVMQILLEILACLRVPLKEEEMEVQKLGEKLHKTLSGRRYLIILDDVWSVEVWDEIKFFFSDYKNRSRVVITTRISSVTNHFGTMGLALNLLDDDQSWNLFCDEVFGQELCPPELEKIGKKIVDKCRGLPLSIVVIGGLLKKSPRTPEYWEYVTKDLTSILTSAENSQCLNILSLSYSHLPVCLKPCFLYLGMFPEDHKFRVSRLVKLWVAEGFLKPNKDQSLEEIAEGYVKDLVDRNLLLVHSLGATGRFKSCYIHDLLRDLCIKIAEKEKFFRVLRELDAPQQVDSERRLTIHARSRIVNDVKSIVLARSVVTSQYSSKLLSRCRLLRVLCSISDYMDILPQQFNLRFLSSTSLRQNCKLSLFWNLQTIFIASTSVVPSEIWEMPQLVHLYGVELRLPNPPPGGTILRNLQTVKRAYSFSFTEEVCKRMASIKRISCHNVRGDHCLYNVSRLSKLESLSYSFIKLGNWGDLVQKLAFPSSLKKLSLEHSWLRWDDLTIIGLLPYLEVLNLNEYSVMGPEWGPIEGEFSCLKYLRIAECDELVRWNADSSHFPVLEKLVLSRMQKLEEIPLDIGEIATLESIYVHECSFSIVVSAAKLLEEQESLGNEGLRVRVGSWNTAGVKEKLEEEGFTSPNLQLVHGDSMDRRERNWIC